MTESFKTYNFEPFIDQALDEIGFSEPTEIQKAVIPTINKGRDLIGQSKTGSGKTHAFLIPLLNHIDLKNDDLQIMITAPSRELSEQLYQVALELVKNADPSVRIGHFVGGQDRQKQVDQFSKNAPQIAIGTPGRLLDMIHSKVLATGKVKAFVVDEADMTLDMGFLNEVDQIANRLPENTQMLVFSATIPQSLKPFLQKYLNNPRHIQIEQENIISDQVENWLVSTKSHDRVDMIYNFLTVGHPYLALIFANTKDKVNDIAERLTERGLKCAIIHGGLSSRERKRVMREIKNLEYQFVVATDLASRGIDIEGVSHVINAEIPNELDFFVHRVGRTGRNNLKGTALTFYSPDEVEAIEYLEEKGIKFEEKRLSRDGEVEDAPHRARRSDRKNKTQKFVYDSEIAGMKKKAKKNIKPGYKKKINRYKKQKQRRLNRIENKRKLRKK